MRKLYTDVTLETPFMVSYNDGQIQACANDEDTITIGAEEFVRITDADGHNVSDREGNQLLLNDGIIYKLVSGVPESTNVQVIDVVIPETCSLTANVTNQELTDADIMIYTDDWSYGASSSDGLTLTLNDVPYGTDLNVQVSVQGYISYFDTVTLTQNEVVNIQLDKLPTIALSSDLTASSELDGVFIKDDTGTDYILTDKGTKVLFDGTSLVEEDTNDAVFDSITNQQIFVNPFTASIETGMYTTSGYTLQSMPTGNIEFDLTNEGSISATTANLEVAAAVSGWTSGYITAPDSGRTTTISVAVGNYVSITGRVGMLYESTESGGDTVIENQTTTISATYEITKVDSGYADITFTNSGSVTATSASLELEVYNSLGQTTSISATDIDSGSLNLELPVDSSCTISMASIGSGYSLDNLSVQSNPFSIEDGQTTSVSVSFEISQDAPQETVIEYTKSGWSYTTTYSGEGQIPANAYLSFDLVNRPNDTTAIQDYNVDCGFSTSNMPYIVHAEGLNYAGSTGYLPISSGIPQDTEGEIGQLAVAGDTYVQECIKKVTLNADNSCEIIVEAVSTGTTRTINVASADNHIDFSNVKSQINTTENADALRHFGYYLAFAFVDSNWQSSDNAPVVKLHIPSA